MHSFPRSFTRLNLCILSALVALVIVLALLAGVERGGSNALDIPTGILARFVASARPVLPRSSPLYNSHRGGAAAVGVNPMTGYIYVATWAAIVSP